MDLFGYVGVPIHLHSRVKKLLFLLINCLSEASVAKNKMVKMRPALAHRSTGQGICHFTEKKVSADKEIKLGTYCLKTTKKVSLRSGTFHFAPWSVIWCSSRFAVCE